MVDYINGIMYIRPSLYTWYESYLILLGDVFDGSWIWFMSILVSIFCISVHKRSHSEFFFVESLFEFGIRLTMTSKNESGTVPSISILWKSLRSTLPGKYGRILHQNYMTLGIFSSKILMTASISIVVIGLFTSS